MRRRLTVTGASENIDGGVEKDHVEEEAPKVATKNKVRVGYLQDCQVLS